MPKQPNPPAPTFPIPSRSTGTASGGVLPSFSAGDHLHEWPPGIQAEDLAADLATTAGLGPLANDVLVMPVFLDRRIDVTTLLYRGSTADAAASYAFGLYDEGGNLVLTTKAIAISTGRVTVSTIYDGSGTAQSTISRPAGQYYFAFTASSTTGKCYGGAAPPVAGMRKRWGVLTGAGGSTLPATITLANVTEDANPKPWIAVTI